MSVPIAVVIPVHNQAFALSMTLHGFSLQSPPYNECPVWVVDDGSTEPVESVVEAYKGLLPVHYVKIRHGGRAAARNAGVERLSDGLVIFNDADRMPRPGFIKAHADRYCAQGEGLTVGQVREMYVPDPGAHRDKVLDNYRLQKNDRQPQYVRLIRRLFAPDGRTDSRVPWITALSGNLSVPVRLYRGLGGFDEKFSAWGFEHFEFGYRAFRKGAEFRYEEEAVNVHLAHPRSAAYEQLIRSSHAYFYEKHNRREIGVFLDFMLGKISLAELERAACPEIPLEPGKARELSHYVRITNLS
ncbi:glycosyltransferase family 2 protein [Paenibacillus chitinolyticus]|uniref:glycosyltransferase family 2 protein n=1 Tax=Paenibacillus chitinolyticus TaxID=79263 RepID=UPI00366502D4